MRPIEQCVPFPVAAVFPLQICCIGIGSAKAIDLHGVIDDQIDRDEWIDSLRIPAGTRHRAPQCGEVDDYPNAGEIQHQYSCRHECNR